MSHYLRRFITNKKDVRNAVAFAHYSTYSRTNHKTPMAPTPKSNRKSKRSGKRRLSIAATPHTRGRSISRMASRTRSISMRSRTRTRSRSSAWSSGGGEQETKGLDHYRMTVRIHPKKYPKGLCPSNTYTDIRSTNVTSLGGRQLYQDIISYCTPDDLLTAQTAAVAGGTLTAPTVYKQSIALFDLNADQRNTGGSLIGAAQIPAQDFLYISSINVMIDMMNQFDAPCEIEFYIVIQKKASFTSPASAIGLGLTNQAMGLGVATQATAGYTVAPNTGYLTSSVPYTQPENSTYWTGQHKVIGRKIIHMASASTAKLSLSINLNVSVSKQVAAIAQANGEFFMAGKTVTIMARILGGIAMDGTGAAPAPTYAPAAVAMMIKSTQKVHPYAKSKKGPQIRTAMWGASAAAYADTTIWNEAGIPADIIANA